MCIQFNSFIQPLLVTVLGSVISTLFTHKLIDEANKKKVLKNLTIDLVSKLDCIYLDLQKQHDRYMKEESLWESNPNQGINPSILLECPSLRIDLGSADGSIDKIAEFHHTAELIQIARIVVSNLSDIYNSFIDAKQNKRSRRHYFQIENGIKLYEKNQNLLNQIKNDLEKLKNYKLIL